MIKPTVYKVNPADGGAFLMRDGRKVFNSPVSIKDAWHEARRLARGRRGRAVLYDARGNIKTESTYEPLDD